MLTMMLRCWLCRVRRLVCMGIWFLGQSYSLKMFNNYVLPRIASGVGVCSRYS